MGHLEGVWEDVCRSSPTQSRRRRARWDVPSGILFVATPGASPPTTPVERHEEFAPHSLRGILPWWLLMTHKT
jgi:hypothetical protein